jgi:hypothetical protein
MATLRVGLFGGIIPRLDPRSLPDVNAQQAINTRLTSGALRPWWRGKEIAVLPQDNYVSFYRYDIDGVQYIAGFERQTKVAKGVLVNDAYDRLYLSNSEGFFVTTKQDLRDGIAPARAGVPVPTFSDAGASAEGGSAAYNTTRVYVATLVTKYGEEGAPQLLEPAIGSSEGKWTIRNLNTRTFDPTYSNVTHLRLYRTITSQTGVDYRLAAEFPIDDVPASYIDEMKDTELASASVLISLGWTMPPLELQGVITLANGFLAGFVGRTVYFSHPYYPHAWPEDYQLAVDDDIVALGTYGNALVIATVNRPAVAMGMTPDAMSLIKSDESIPCLSARSLVSSTSAVMYASERGLVAYGDAGGFQTLTEAFLKGDEWRELYRPENIAAMLYEGRYLGMYGQQLGFSLDFSDPTSGFTEIQQTGVRAIGQDDVSGYALMLLEGGRVVQFDGDYMHPMTYNWRSKRYMVGKPQNFGAFQLRGEFDRLTQLVQPPLPNAPNPHGDTINDETINDDEIGGTDPGVRTGWEILDAVLVRVFCDQKLVMEKLVRDEKPHRLPSGYKGSMFEFELSGQVPVSSFTLASTIKALETVP